MAHIFGDEDNAFREDEENAWRSLSDAQKSDIRAQLKKYNPKNEAQLIEEWAIYKAENNGMSIKQ